MQDDKQWDWKHLTNLLALHLQQTLKDYHYLEYHTLVPHLKENILIHFLRHGFIGKWPVNLDLQNSQYWPCSLTSKKKERCHNGQVKLLSSAQQTLHYSRAHGLRDNLPHLIQRPLWERGNIKYEAARDQIMDLNFPLTSPRLYINIEEPAKTKDHVQFYG